MAVASRFEGAPLATVLNRRATDVAAALGAIVVAYQAVTLAASS